jgi:hypothetical protein
VDLNTVTEYVPGSAAAWRDGNARLGGGTAWVLLVEIVR